jgi:hypothetical protein
VSNLAQACPSCGYLVNHPPIDEVKTNSEYKKFDFDQIKKIEEDPKFVEKCKAEMQKGKRVTFLVAAGLLVLALVVANLGGQLAGAIFILLLISSIYVFRMAFNVRSAANSNLYPYPQFKIIDFYYKKNIKKFTTVPKDLNYKVIAVVTADTELNLLKKAYDLRADALINLHVQKYASNDLNGSVKKHENWTADAVIVNSELYYEPLDYKSI